MRVDASDCVETGQLHSGGSSRGRMKVTNSCNDAGGNEGGSRDDGYSEGGGGGGRRDCVRVCAKERSQLKCNHKRA